MNKYIKKSHALNLALFFAISALIALIVHGNRFHNKTNTPSQRTTEQDSQNKKTHIAITRNSSHIKTPLEGVIHPPKENLNTKPSKQTDLSKSPIVLRKMLKKQSLDLRIETGAEDIRPSKKRSLTLTEKEILELENSGRMLY